MLCCATLAHSNNTGGDMPEKTIQCSIRIPVDLYDFLQEDAKKNVRTFSNEMIYLLRRMAEIEQEETVLTS